MENVHSRARVAEDPWMIWPTDQNLMSSRAPAVIACIQGVLALLTTVLIGPAYRWLWNDALLKDVQPFFTTSSTSLRSLFGLMPHEFVVCMAIFSGE